MGVISVPNTFAPNTAISSSAVNSNFATIYNEFNGAVGEANIADNAVTTAKIDDDAVTTAKIADDAITPAKVSNPYKFSVRKTTAQTVGTAATKVQWDTEDFDTNNNFDNATNYRYVAPVNGYYYFTSTIGTVTAGAATRAIMYLYKNGAEIARGSDLSMGAVPYGLVASTFIQLTAGDYMEVYIQTLSATKALEFFSGVVCRFSGFLVSET